MAYATLDDIKRLLRTTKDRITFGTAASDHMTESDANSFISDVESAEIDAYLSPYYSTPLSGSHTIVKNISMYFSAYEIWLAIHGSNQTIDELPPTVREWRAKAERLRDLLIEQAQSGYYLPGETLAASRETGDVAIQVTAWDWQYEEDVTFTKRNWSDLDNPRVIRGTEEVYNRVVREGKRWIARAFVVEDWYITAYGPIRDLNDRVIGILYVGVLAGKFEAMRQ